MVKLSEIEELQLAKEKGFAILKIAISRDINDEFKVKCSESFKKHNANILSNEFPDSGLDLMIPDNVYFDTLFKSSFVNLGVRACMTYRDKPCAFIIHPRSSISKTPLMLANHTGIIDSGYRGPLIAALRLLPYNNTTQYTVDKYTRLVQICHPSLCPVYVIECSENDLPNTERGEGGFGSTGK